MGKRPRLRSSTPLLVVSDLQRSIDFYCNRLGFSDPSVHGHPPWEIHKLPPDNLLSLPRSFAAVTPAEVQRVARENLHPDACCLSAADPTTKRELRAMLDS